MENTVIQNQENVSVAAEAAIESAKEMASSNSNLKVIVGAIVFAATLIGGGLYAKKRHDKKKAQKEANKVETVEADGNWHVTDEKN